MKSGTRKYAYEVFLELGTLYLGVKFPCKVGTVWESHMKTTQSKNKPDLVSGTAFLSESFSDRFVFDYDMSNNAFSPRLSVIKFLLYTQKGVREAGQVQFDMTDSLNKRVNQMKLELPLQNCPDKNARLSLTIKTQMKQQIVGVQANYTAGLVSDIVRTGGTPLVQPISNQAQGFKKKVKIQLEPNYQVSQPVVIRPPQDNSAQMESILAQNKRLSASLLQAQAQTQTLRVNLQQHMQEKHSLQGQIQSFSLEVNTLRVENSQLQLMQLQYSNIQEELINTRTQLARIFNAAAEIGGPELTDQLQNAIGIAQR